MLVLRRRKFVSGVVLALLIGATLFLTIGPADTGKRSSGKRATSPLEKQAERIEKRLAKSPNDEQLLLALTRAWVDAGNDRIERRVNVTQSIPSAVVDFRASLRAWNRYLKQTGGEASAAEAELASGTFFQLVEIGSRNLSELESWAAAAARAQRIAGEHQPTLFTLSNVAVYDYFNGEFAAGDKAAKGAAADVTPKTEAKGVEIQLDEYRERGKKFTMRLKRAAKELQESGQKQLRAPVKGYGSPAGINGRE